jgi:primosomal protein N' (replication factor Y)
MTSEASVGKRVLVPIGKSKLYTGIASKIHTNPPADYKARYIDCFLDNARIVNEKQLDFWRWMSAYYMCAPGEILLAALPSGLRLSSESKYLSNPQFDGDISGLTEREILLLDVMERREVMDSSEISEILGIKSIQPILKRLLECSAILVMEDVKERYKPKIRQFIELSDECKDEEGLQAAFRSVSKAPRQEEVLLSFLNILAQTDSKEKNSVAKTRLQKVSNATSGTINQMIKKGVFVVREEEVGRLNLSNEIKTAIKPLNDAQAGALESIRSIFNEKSTVLLHGVTSSGKTEVYIHLIRDFLDRGQQVLYMLPEIALTTQMIGRLQEQFGEQVLVYHSGLNQNEKVESWNLILEKDRSQGRLVVGARSTVFLPFSDLGLVIVDEEHENSYKQYDPAPRYHGRDSAIVLGSFHNAKVVLGTATPSYESLYNAKNGKYGYVELTERFGGVSLPEINIESLVEKGRGSVTFSSALIEEIGKTLERKEQVVLFQNRRGYSPVLICEDCGWTPECSRCDVSLTYHKSREQFLCHYCGNRYAIPSSCAACGSHKLKLAGYGTERIEEEISIYFPDAVTARFDLDSTRGKNGYRRILDDLHDGSIDILVGTQMVTKGLDFERVTLVGILNADLLLKYPDFRATERGFQLMTQVAGRAGRRQKPGKVIIQSYDPTQWILKQVQEGNYLEVYSQESGERRKFDYPPYTRLIQLTLRHKDPNLVDYSAKEYFEQLIQWFPKQNILGPEYPSIARIKNQYNKNILLKIKSNQGLQEVKAQLKHQNSIFFSRNEFRPVRLVINVDPM